VRNAGKDMCSGVGLSLDLALSGMFNSALISHRLSILTQP